MIPVLILGCGIGLGVLVVVRAVWAPAPKLVDALTRLDRPARPRGHRVGDPTLSGLDRAPEPPALERLVEKFAPGLVERSARRAADLRVTDRTPQRYAVEKLVATACGLFLPIVLVALAGLGGVAVSVIPTTFAALGLAIGGWVLPDVSLRDAAARRRREMRHALSSYLDLVNVVLAGGAGVETALEAAAEAGDGWAFAELRTALARSRVLRRSPWACFSELGAEVGVVELSELAASVRLAGEQGARIKVSLAAKAASLRGHQLAEVEASAQSASERMALPTVLMFVGFLLFIGYPAVVEIVGGSGL